MGLIKNTVHYCCVSRDNQILYSYNGGDHSNEGLAALCLEKSPPFHNWYFETIGKRRFGFLIGGDGFVYFAIVDEALRRSSVLKFLEHLRDEFKKAARKNCRGSSFTAMIGSIDDVEHQLVPVVTRLIASLERVAESANNDLKTQNSNLGEQSEGSSNSTKAPLLGRLGKQEKKKGKDHLISVRGIELEEHRKSSDRENRTEASAGAGTECVSSSRGRSVSQSFEWKWRRLVQVVLAIDAAICLTLFGIWLAICRGIECTRS
ncbi:PREDICTED: phytolongin Phyl1.1-like [Camelina sativa]|uniref:Phytolongin Phyl1.1-like n=1 Tax=Camelina sativa TaxID=90675 RepID=A0ABM0T795_CAMSA|nr:PREDICTED: phytolongin Phyl1.1-like [Camelina sativa]